MQFTRVPWSGPDIKALPAAPWFIGSAHEWLLYPQLDCESPGGEVGHGFGGDLVRPPARSRAGFEARLCKGLWLAVIYLPAARAAGRQRQECREDWISWSACLCCSVWDVGQAEHPPAAASTHLGCTGCFTPPSPLLLLQEVKEGCLESGKGCLVGCFSLDYRILVLEVVWWWSFSLCLGFAAPMWRSRRGARAAFCPLPLGKKAVKIDAFRRLGNGAFGFTVNGKPDSAGGDFGSWLALFLGPRPSG